MSISFRKFIQIAGVKDSDEANMLVDCGVHFIGFPFELAVHKQDLSEDEAADIIQSLAPPYYGVLITYLDGAADIISLCDKLGCSVVQLHGEVSLEDLSMLKRDRPELTVIKSLIVSEDNLNELINEVDKQTKYVDAFITDTYDHSTGASGATGKTHDWNVSRTLVDYASKPVILAGGLNETNVYEAIKFVAPAGVDTHTGVEGGNGRKDVSLVRKFVDEANRALKEL